MLDARYWLSGHKGESATCEKIFAGLKTTSRRCRERNVPGHPLLAVVVGYIGEQLFQASRKCKCRERLGTNFLT